MSHLITQSATIITLLASYLYFVGYLSFVIYLGGFGLNVETFSRPTFTHIAVGAMSLVVTPPIFLGFPVYGALFAFIFAAYKKILTGPIPYFFLFVAALSWGGFIAYMNGSLATERISENPKSTIVVSSKNEISHKGRIIHQDATKIALYTDEKDVLVVPLNTIEYYSITTPDKINQERPDQPSKKDP